MADKTPTLYGGLLEDDYMELLEIEELTDWLRGNMTKVTGDSGVFYIYTGDGEDDGPGELAEMLELFGDPDMVTQFTYLYSTWSIYGPALG